MFAVLSYSDIISVALKTAMSSNQKQATPSPEERPQRPNVDSCRDTAIVLSMNLMLVIPMCLSNI